MNRFNSGMSNGKEDNKSLFIAIGCGLSLLLVIAIASVLYAKERSRNSTYKRYFMENNNYTVCFTILYINPLRLNINICVNEKLLYSDC